MQAQSRRQDHCKESKQIFPFFQIAGGWASDLWRSRPRRGVGGMGPGEETLFTCEIVNKVCQAQVSSVLLSSF